MSERELQETVQLKSELETAKRESHVAKERCEEIKKEAEESASKATQQIDILSKQLEEEKSKCNTHTQCYNGLCKNEWECSTYGSLEQMINLELIIHTKSIVIVETLVILAKSATSSVWMENMIQIF